MGTGGVDGGAVGTGGAGGGDAGHTYACRGRLGTGGFAEGIPDAAFMDTCITGETYCGVQEIADRGGDYMAMCHPLPASCPSPPTCDCIQGSSSINCTCFASGGELTVTCSSI
jgi:hypothetical protein